MNQQLNDIETPALLIEKSVMERNIREMQKLADAAKINLRPHIKTHKSVYLARKQIKEGAVGIACAKTSEAEVFAKAGFKDIQIANIVVGKEKIACLFKLSLLTDALSCCVDSVEGARRLSEVFSKSKKPLKVLLMIDCGYQRCGLSEIDEIIYLAAVVQKLEGLDLKGITTHAGQAYAAKSSDEREKIALKEGKFLVYVAEKLRDKGLKIEEVTVGSNPTARTVAKVKGITELRTGNYIFNDMIQVSLGTVSVDKCALSVLAQVISVPSYVRAIIDAGSKSLSSDQGAHGNKTLTGYGKIIGKKSKLARLSEEHGIIERKDEEPFKIGEKIRIIPNHACATNAMFEKAYLVDCGKVTSEIDIEAIGKIY